MEVNRIKYSCVCCALEPMAVKIGSLLLYINDVLCTFS